MFVVSGHASMISKAPSTTSPAANQSSLWHDVVDVLPRHLAVVVVQHHLVVDVAHPPLDGQREDVLAVVVVAVVVLSSRTPSTRSNSHVLYFV